MPINGIVQPEVVPVDERLRLRKYDGDYSFALPWYQDEELVYLVDGKREPYTMEKLGQMYRYLDQIGELYFIEVLEGGSYVPVGDVTFWQDDMPVVIGEKGYRGHGLGRKVVAALVERGRELGYDRLYVNEIYDYNMASKRCFESAGFRAYEKTQAGERYCCIVSNEHIDEFLRIC